jgi:regulator of RNase E activity RraA
MPMLPASNGIIVADDRDDMTEGMIGACLATICVSNALFGVALILSVI